jgi:hypothetical protein
MRTILDRQVECVIIIEDNTDEPDYYPVKPNQSYIESHYTNRWNLMIDSKESKLELRWYYKRQDIDWQSSGWIATDNSWELVWIPVLLNNSIERLITETVHNPQSLSYTKESIIQFPYFYEELEIGMTRDTIEKHFKFNYYKYSVPISSSVFYISSWSTNSGEIILAYNGPDILYAKCRNY